MQIRAKFKHQSVRKPYVLFTLFASSLLCGEFVLRRVCFAASLFCGEFVLRRVFRGEFVRGEFSASSCRGPCQGRHNSPVLAGAPASAKIVAPVVPYLWRLLYFGSFGDKKVIWFKIVTASQTW